MWALNMTGTGHLQSLHTNSSQHMAIGPTALAETARRSGRRSNNWSVVGTWCCAVLDLEGSGEEVEEEEERTSELHGKEQL